MKQKKKEEKMLNEKIEKIVGFLNETEKNLRELEMSEESYLQLQTELEDTYDIEDENERSNEYARLEREHSDMGADIDSLQNRITEDFTIEVAKDLVPFVNKLLNYTSSIQNRLDRLVYDAKELSDENEINEFWSEKWNLNEQKVSQ